MFGGGIKRVFFDTKKSIKFKFSGTKEEFQKSDIASALKVGE